MKPFLQKLLKRLLRRIGTAVGASGATFVALSPEQAAILQAALIAAGGVAVDVMLANWLGEDS